MVGVWIGVGSLVWVYRVVWFGHTKGMGILSEWWYYLSGAPMTLIDKKLTALHEFLGITQKPHAVFASETDPRVGEHYDEWLPSYYARLKRLAKTKLGEEHAEQMFQARFEDVVDKLELSARGVTYRAAKRIIEHYESEGPDTFNHDQLRRDIVDYLVVDRAPIGHVETHMSHLKYPAWAINRAIRGLRDDNIIELDDEWGILSLSNPPAHTLSRDQTSGVEILLRCVEQLASGHYQGAGLNPWATGRAESALAEFKKHTGGI